MLNWKFIKSKRKAKGIKQYVFAKRIQRSQSYVSNLENGRVYGLTAKTLRKISVVLEVLMDDLMVDSMADAEEDIVSKILNWKFIKSKRKAKGITQYVFAERIGRNQPLVSRLENGSVYEMSEKTLRKISVVLEVSMDDLMVDEE